MILLFINSCNFEKNERQIDFEKSVELAKYMGDFSINQLAIHRSGFLKVDNYVILPDSVDKDSIEIGLNDSLIHQIDWLKTSDLTKKKLNEIKRLLIDSNNEKINYENGAYFFMTGGWIDAQWGKVYSISDISDKEDFFKFERIKDIDPIENKQNWFDYYID
jgi:hypothetical protein